MVLMSLISPLLDDAGAYHTISFFQTLNSMYHLPNNALPEYFEEHWLSVLHGSMSWPSFVTSPIDILESLILPFIKCSKPNIMTIPYLSHISLLNFTDCFNSPETHFVAYWIPQCGSLKENYPKKNWHYWEIWPCWRKYAPWGWGFGSLLLKLPTVWLSIFFILPSRCNTFSSSTTAAWMPPGSASWW